MVLLLLAVLILVECAMSVDKSETQIVPYQQLSFMEVFSKDFRVFNLSGKEWKISQNWNAMGVAGVVWNAAIVLSKYMERHKEILYNAHVVELGSGTGLVGMLASCLGANSVTVTDKHIDMIHENIKANRHNFEKIINVEHYEWGKPIPSSLTPPYDVILGADIVYIENTYQDLISSFNMLSGDSTIILLCLMERYSKVQQFLDLLSENSYTFRNVYSENSTIIYEISCNI